MTTTFIWISNWSLPDKWSNGQTEKRTASVLLLLAAVMCTLGETSNGDSASECVDSQQISTSVCQTAPARMCEATRRVSSDICDDTKGSSSAGDLSGSQGFTSFTAKRAAGRELQGLPYVPGGSVWRDGITDRQIGRSAEQRLLTPQLCLATLQRVLNYLRATLLFLCAWP